MALNVGQLRSRIQSVFDQRLHATTQIANRIAQAYYAYAIAAQAPPGAPVILKGSESRMFEQALIALMDQRLAAAPAANSLAGAVAAFWMAPPVTTSAGGVVVSAATAAAVSKLVGTRASDASQASMALAQSLDLMTRMVIVANPFPLLPGPLF